MTELGVVIVAFAGAQILDVTGPLEVFSTASRFVASISYATRIVSADGGPALASCGLRFATTPISGVRGPIDTLVVAGGADTDLHPNEEFLWHLRRLAGTSRRVTSVCSGAFLLAAAGLLDGRRATTHWRECHELAADSRR